MASRLLLPRRQRLHLGGSPEVWSLRTILHLLDTQQLSCEQLAQYCYFTALAGDDIWELRAFSRLSSWDSIQKAAQASDERRREGRPKSQLDGIPLTVKANIAIQDQALTAGSKILGEATKTNAIGYNAEIVHHLVEECGAVCIGITNMDEFGMGSLGSNCIAGKLPTQNPLAFLPPNNSENTSSLLDVIQQSQSDIAQLHEKILASNPPNNHYSAGGSSCGAAASIAHGSSLIALASDTGGSIRLPAAWCNVVGLKTSYGRISRNGLVSYASSLDTIGFLTRTVDCAKLVLDELTDKEQQSDLTPKDSTSYFYSLESTKDSRRESTSKLDSESLKGIKIGIPAAFVVGECPDSIKDAWSQGASLLQEAGATVVTIGSDIVSPNVIQQSLAAYYVLASAEASSNLARYDGFRYGVQATQSKETSSSSDEETLLQRQYANNRTQGFGQEVIRRILCGTAVLSSDKFHTHYESAAKLRALVTKQLHEALESQVDFLLIPTAVSPPPTLSSGDEHDSSVDSTAMFGNDIMTVPISLAGLSAVNVPMSSLGSSQDEAEVENAIGLQLVGHRLQERDLLEVAKYLER